MFPGPNQEHTFSTGGNSARAVGIDAVQFENAAQLARELKARGIRWE